MKRAFQTIGLAAPAALAFLFYAAGCGGTYPLLGIISAEQQSMPGPGSWWSYQALSGGPNFTRSTTTTAQVAGLEATPLLLSASPGGPAQRLSGPLVRDSFGLQLFDSSPAPGQWRLERKLPYVVGASWPLEIQAGEGGHSLAVDGMETVETAAGTFENCYRLVETILDLSDPPLKAEWVVWVSPTVGDVKYGRIDATGALVEDYELTAYSLVP